MEWVIPGLFVFGILWTMFIVVFRPAVYMQWAEHKERRRRARWGLLGKAASLWMKSR